MTLVVDALARSAPLRKLRLAAGAAALLLAAAGCNPFATRTDESSSGRPGVSSVKARSAKALIEGRSGSKLSGEATFTETDGAVKVLITVKNAPPGMHAVHVHEKGDCSAADAMSAGDHFNPDNHQHGSPTSPEHHAGDFGNMEVGGDGTGRKELVSKDITVSDGIRSVVGRAIVVHEKADDMTTQPAGNAGGRIGCGVIRGQQ